jgi:hypothetical protein
MATRKKKKKKRGGLDPELKLLIAGILSAALAAGGFIFWTATRPETGETQQAVCALVIDRTSTSSDQEIIDSYRQESSAAIAGCRDRKALLSIYYFDQSGPKLQLAKPSDASEAESFRLWQPLEAKASVGEKKLEETVEQAHLAVEWIFSQSGEGERRSDIVTAIDSAADILRSQAIRDEVDEKYLIVLTDGLQTSTDITVETFVDESVDVMVLVDRVRQLNLVPDGLNDTQVTFVGVGNGIYPGTGIGEVNQWFEAKIKAFWEGLIKEGGGRMCAYRQAASASNETQSDLPSRC